MSCIRVGAESWSRSGPVGKRAEFVMRIILVIIAFLLGLILWALLDREGLKEHLNPYLDPWVLVCGAIGAIFLVWWNPGIIGTAVILVGLFLLLPLGIAIVEVLTRKKRLERNAKFLHSMGVDPAKAVKSAQDIEKRRTF
jgi:hypothetical protein